MAPSAAHPPACVTAQGAGSPVAPNWSASDLLENALLRPCPPPPSAPLAGLLMDEVQTTSGELSGDYLLCGFPATVQELEEFESKVGTAHTDRATAQHVPRCTGHAGPGGSGG